MDLNVSHTCSECITLQKGNVSSFEIFLWQLLLMLRLQVVTYNNWSVIRQCQSLFNTVKEVADLYFQSFMSLYLLCNYFFICSTDKTLYIVNKNIKIKSKDKNQFICWKILDFSFKHFLVQHTNQIDHLQVNILISNTDSNWYIYIF